MCVVCACLIGHVCRVCCICRVLPEPSRTGWSIRPWRTGLSQASRTGGSLWPADTARCSCLGCILDDGVVCYVVCMLVVYCWIVYGLEFTKLRAYPPFPLLVEGISGNKKGKELAWLYTPALLLELYVLLPHLWLLIFELMLLYYVLTFWLI